MNRKSDYLLNITRRHAFLILLLLFFVSIILRLPNLNRPVSKHHEFVAATILMNIESWRQAGGGSHFHYTPLMNYQNAADKLIEKGVYVDPKGNWLYLSLGPAWYIIPYFVYQVFHLPADPLYLRILNLVINLITVILCFYFFGQLIPPDTENRYFRVLAGSVLFLFSPGILWYFGNGYVHTAIMLPVIIMTLMVLLPMLQNPSGITSSRLLLLSALIILLVYLDWFAVFLCLTTGLWAFFRKGGDRKKYLMLSFVLFTALLTGITLIFWQFASYAGLPTVLGYWKLRFLERSFANDHTPFWAGLLSLAIHTVTCYLPILILLAGSKLAFWLKKPQNNLSGQKGFSGQNGPRQGGVFSSSERLFIGIYACSAFLYDLVLFNWSTGHEFSVMPAGLLLAYLGARLLIVPHKKRNAYFLIASFFIVTIIQYYYINRPGAISRDGMAFNAYEIFGRRLKQIPLDYRIFAHIENCPMIEYYAGRNMTLVRDSGEAKKRMQEWDVKKAVWIEQEDFRIQKMIVLHPE